LRSAVAERVVGGEEDVDRGAGLVERFDEVADVEHFEDRDVRPCGDASHVAGERGGFELSAAVHERSLCGQLR
jgi:hypothetical protein